MPCTYFRNPQHAFQSHWHHDLRGPYPIGAQFDCIAIIRYTESGMCDSSANVAIILYDQKVRHGIVRQALLSGYEHEPCFGRTTRDIQQL